MKIILMLTGLIIISSCGGPIRDGGAIELTPSGPPAEIIESPLRAEEITFALVQSKVISGRCLNCHSKERGNRGDINLETYENVFANRESMRDDIANNDMPKKSASQLTEAQKDFILRWIDGGAYEFAGNPGRPDNKNPVSPPAPPVVPITSPPPKEEPVDVTNPPVDSFAVSFENVMQKVITPKCLGCHDPSSGSAALTSYDRIFAMRNDIKSEIESDRMPQDDTLTPEEKKLILDWLNSGAKNI